VANPVLLLADDSAVLLTILVERLRTRFRVAGTPVSGMSILDQIAAISPDIAILGISLGDLTGFDIARNLRDRGCPAKNYLLDTS
jgi:DNA-binding response OmpR family regulator